MYYLVFNIFEVHAIKFVEKIFCFEKKMCIFCVPSFKKLNVMPVSLRVLFSCC